ncbi:MAG: glutamine--fructose-6-phosphate transaminase (isomerizing) [Pseudomonadota bacterium]
MCGIVGYVGSAPAHTILLDGLKRLEYRGYDSAGIAVVTDGNIQVARAKGKIRALEEAVVKSSFLGTLGVGHTRWATHGRPSEPNAHPHRAGRAVVVHNGIIENYTHLKRDLIAGGRTFTSETDTEVIAQLLDKHLEEGMETVAALRKTCGELKGSFACAVLVEGDPDTLYGIRKESPLIVGLGDGECFLASDIPAILSYTRRMVFMEDGEIAILKRDAFSFISFSGEPVDKPVRTVDLNPVMAEKGGYKHFMLKEIFEQPRAVTDTFRGRVSEETGQVFLDQLRLTDEDVDRLQRVIIIACGTSYHAGLVGKRIIESLARVPVDVDLASEFRYRDPIVNENTLIISISQSGETADTIAATKEAAERGGMVVAVCNVIESSLARISDRGVLYTHAGPEIGVASTKAFTTQITVLYLLGIYLGIKRGRVGQEDARSLIGDLVRLPGLMERSLETSGRIAGIARIYEGYPSFLFLGRGVNTAIAYEGALKLKEISYIHAEAYAGGEMKHGPIALISEQMPVVALLAKDRVYEKMLSNMEEVHTRSGILLVVLAGDEAPEASRLAEEMITVPGSNEFLTAILLTLPLQLLAYHIADFKGTDVDQPRNLAKSVTVE